MKKMVQNRKINMKHNNQIRIIGGQLRGRKIAFPSVEGLRPTPDSVRERLFNWLGQDLTGQVVLDLFAGSGALGFEAVSRHARQVLMCEINREAVQNLRDCARQFQIADRVQIHQQDGLVFLSQALQVFDLILLDPPFDWDNWVVLLSLLSNRLKSDGYLYIEARDLPDLSDDWQVVREGRAGESRQWLLQKM